MSSTSNKSKMIVAVAAFLATFNETLLNVAFSPIIIVVGNEINSFL